MYILYDYITLCIIISYNNISSQGISILRKDAKSHISNDCLEKLLDCSNQDCKEQIARKSYDKHVTEECEDRFIECPFSKYGCSVTNIKAKNLELHKEAFKLDHISNQFNQITNQVSLF